MNGFETADLSRIKELKKRIGELSDLYGEAKAITVSVTECCDNDCIVSAQGITELIEAWRRLLCARDAVRDEYAEISDSAIPATIGDLLENLGELERRRSELAVYFDAIGFFTDLGSENDDLAKYLEMLKHSLTSLDIGGLTSDYCKSELDRFITLKEYFNMEDGLEKFETELRLVQLFTPGFVYAVKTGSVKPISVVSDELMETETEAVVGWDETSEAKTEAVVESDETSEAETEAVVESDETSEAETEAAVESDETSEAKTEAAVESDETSEAKTEAVAKTEEVSEAETKKKELATWESLGISKPDAVCISLDDGTLLVECGPKAKPFGVKRFQSDIAKIAVVPNIAWVFKCYMINHAMTAEFIAFSYNAIIKPKNPTGAKWWEGICEKLLRLGYLKKYTLGNNAPFYVLDKNGREVMENDTTRNYLKLSKLERGDETKDSANAAMIRVLVNGFHQILEKFIPEFDFNKCSAFLNTDFFLTKYTLTDDDRKTLLYFGIVSDNPEQFESLLDCLERGFDNCSVLIASGVNVAHAKALADFIYEKFLDRIAEKRFLYLDTEQKRHYDYSTGFAVDLLDAQIPENIGKIAEVCDTEETVTHNNDGNDENEDETITDAFCEGEALVIKSDGDSSLVAEEVDDNSKEAAESSSTDMLDGLDTGVTDDAARTSADTRCSEVKVGAKLYGDDGRYTANVIEMIRAGYFYCACAYLRALKDRYPHFEKAYCELAYAVNDPYENCEYTSDNIFDIYFSGNNVNEYYAVAAAIRTFFSAALTYDHSLQSLKDSVRGLSPMANNSALSSVIHTLQSFKSEYNYGIEHYADYRQLESSSFDAHLASVCRNAREIYDNYILRPVREKASNERALETKRLVFATDGELAAMIEAAMNDEREMLSLIEEYLKVTFIKDGAEISVANISTEKLERFADTYWDKAGVVLNMRFRGFTGSPKNGLISNVKRAVTVLCDYMSVVRYADDNTCDNGKVEYRKRRDTLLSDIDSAIEQLDVGSMSMSIEEETGLKVLLSVMCEMRDKINGDYAIEDNRYFYVDFLRTGHILLDNMYFPVLDDVSEIESMSVLSRIEEFFKSSLPSLEERLFGIGRNGDDDYGSAILIQKYFANHRELVTDNSCLGLEFDESIVSCENGMKIKRKDFIGHLELAQSYGQIADSEKKEAWVQIMDFWYTRTMSMNNFGFFYKLCDAIKCKVMEEATIRRADLLAQLENFLSQESERERTEEEKLAVESAVSDIRSKIDSRYYAAAEDKLNRLCHGDTGVSTSVIDVDYLEVFLAEFDINGNYAGNAGSTDRLYRLRDALAASKTSSVRAGAKLIGAWPTSNNTSTSKIKELLQYLQFPNATEAEVRHESDRIKGKYDDYHVFLRRPSNGKRNNYQHPISAFGSHAEERGFRIVTINSNMNETELVEVIKEIGDTLPTIILLDAKLSLPDRRELARRAKLECNTTPFIVIDRIALVFLARSYDNYSQEINRVLMAITVPFAAYQPYISESSKPMPQEMFMGRSRELSQIESMYGVSLVYGGRQLGKSRLLAMAQKRRDRNSEGDRAVLVDIKTKDYRAAAERVSEELSRQGIFRERFVTDSWDELETAIRDRLADTSNPITYLLLLLDEADIFIKSSESIGYAPIDCLKRIQEGGRFKFVIAGLHNIVRFNRGALAKNSDIVKLDNCTIKPFNSYEARELLETPLFYLGFRFPKDSTTEMLISTILGTTNYFPGLIQLYCQKLIESTQQHDYAGYTAKVAPPYIIGEKQIRNVLADRSLNEEIKKKFDITLTVDEDDYYKPIAILAAFHYHNAENGQTGCSASEIHTYSRDFGIAKLAVLSLDDIAAYMEEMVELNILRNAGNDRYRFARYNFCQMMGTPKQIDDEILKYSDSEEA